MSPAHPNLPAAGSAAILSLHTSAAAAPVPEPLAEETET